MNRKRQSSSEIPEAPAGLSDRAVALWRAIAPRVARTPERRVLLEEALRALTRADEASAMVAAEGATIRTASTGMVRAHPALKTERDFRALAARLLAQLGAADVWEDVA
jgi:phage terminase small subunit